jgi:hypothetical protein
LIFLIRKFLLRLFIPIIKAGKLLLLLLARVLETTSVAYNTQGSRIVKTFVLAKKIT